MAKSNSSIWVSLGLNTDKFKKGIKGAKGSMSSLKGGLSALSPVSLGVAGALAGIGVAVGNAIKTFKDFEKAGSDLKAVLGKNALPADLESLATQAKALGAATSFTATEVRGLQKEFAKLGFDSGQIENMTEATLNLAAAAGSELAEAASLAGSTINAFGLNSTDASHVTDVMAASFSRSALDMEKFSETMKNAAPIARATGVSLEVATAAAGKLADANITGSKAGTDLKKIFSELVKDGKPFADSLNDIAGEMDGVSTDAEKLAIAEDLVGDRAKGALLILVDQKKELGQLAGALEIADGAAKDMADTMLNNLSGDMTKASSAWEGFVLDLEDGEGRIALALRGVVQSFTDMLQTIKEDDIGDALGIERGLFQNLNQTQQSLVNLSQKTSKMAATFAEGKTSIVQFMNKTIELRKKQGELNRETEEGNAKWLIYDDLIKKLDGKAASLAEKNTKLAKGLEETGDEIDGVTGSTNELSEAIKRVPNVAKVEVSTSVAADSIALMSEDIKSKMSLKGLAVEVPVKAIGVAEFAAGMKTASIALEETIIAKQEKLLATSVAVGDAVAGAFGGLADSMVASMGLASTGMDGFVSGLATTVTKLIAMMLSSSISQAIAGATASGTATGPAAVFATPAFIATAVGGILGSFAAIPAFAEGVNNFGGGTALVGELGPELVNLPRGSDVIPNNKLGDMGGGGSGGKVVFEIQGSKLVGILQREMKVNKFS